MGRFDEWVRGGQISFEQAEAMEGSGGRPAVSGPRTTEVLGYFGAAAVAVATIVLAVDVAFDDGFLSFFLGTYDNLSAGAIALVGAALLLYLGTRFADSTAGAVRRSGGFTLFAGFGLATVAFAFLLADLDLADFTPLVRVLPTLAVGLYVWQRLPSVPTQLAMFLVAIDLVNALLVLFQLEDIFDPASTITQVAIGGNTEFNSWVSWLAGTALGIAWVWLGSTGRARPRNAAFVFGGLYAWTNGLLLFSTADGWIVLSIAIAAGFLYGAVTWRSSVLGAFGTLAVVTLILQVIDMTVDAPTANTFVIAYGVPGLLALAGAWWWTKPATPAASTTTADGESAATAD